VSGLRIRTQGHEEGDLLVHSLHASSGEIRDGIAVRFEKQEGFFVLNTADLTAVIEKAKA
jgi:hypothetical protein